MGKQISDRAKKIVGILLLVSLVVSLTVASATAGVYSRPGESLARKKLLSDRQTDWFIGVKDGAKVGYREGYKQGYKDGLKDYNSGKEEQSFTPEYTSTYKGFDPNNYDGGYSIGKSNGYQDGYIVGYKDGYDPNHGVSPGTLPPENEQPLIPRPNTEEIAKYDITTQDWWPF
jgi:hypothetical protein